MFWLDQISNDSPIFTHDFTHFYAQAIKVVFFHFYYELDKVASVENGSSTSVGWWTDGLTQDSILKSVTNNLSVCGQTEQHNQSIKKWSLGNRDEDEGWALLWSWRWWVLCYFSTTTVAHILLLASLFAVVGDRTKKGVRMNCMGWCI